MSQQPEWIDIIMGIASMTPVGIAIWVGVRMFVKKMIQNDVDELRGAK